jgi:hypothetical protein
MLKIVARGCAPLAAMFALTGPTPAAAQVVELSGPEAFSGTEVQLDFEDPNLFDGMPVPEFDGVAIDLEDASSPSYGGARFGLAFEPREFGPGDPGSVNNFGVGDLPFPFPAMRLSFPSVVHRVAFAARANELDDVVVTFRRAGQMVGQVSRRSPSQASFHFYGFESMAGFDEVVVDATENFTGAFSMDNLTYEVLAAPDPDPDPDPEPDPGPDPEPDPEPDPGPDPEPEPEVPSFACEGFDHPEFETVDRFSHGGLRNLCSRLLKQLPYRLLRAQLVDDHGVPVTDVDLVAAPRVRVLHTPPGGDETNDVTARAVPNGNPGFAHRRNGFWQKLLRNEAFEASGTYVVTLESGDPAEYAVDPACVDWLVREPRDWRHKRDKRRHHRHGWDRDDD